MKLLSQRQTVNLKSTKRKPSCAWNHNKNSGLRLFRNSGDQKTVKMAYSKRNCQPIILYPVKISFKDEGKNRFPNNKKIK